jgi:hypothetical protein
MSNAVEIGRSALQQSMIVAMPCPVVRMDTDHSPFYSAPDQLAMALASIAAGTLDCS